MQRIVEIDGDWWPSADTECRPAVISQFKDVDTVLEYCGKKNVVIQAGGNCGIWPRYLAGIFKTVYTFEPDPDNFLCLNLNARAPNIIKMQAALGEGGDPLSMTRTPENAGGHSISIHLNPDLCTIPQIAIDHLRLRACDLIQLDLEGFEYAALVGARKTIKRHRPVLMIEDKGHEKKYGIRADAMHNLLREWGYVLVERIHRDIIMVPGESCA